MLQAEPREPVLLNYAGVIFYELGAVKAADARCSPPRSGWTPSCPTSRRNLAQCTRRRRKGVRVVAQAAGPVRDLQPRVDRIAAAARPAEGLTLSLCMIVKDEEAMIGRCLEAARDAVDEIVVVDTGSTDRTIEIAERHGARVLHHAWDGDFSEARNVSFDAATGDWVMYLDADEVLVAEDAQRLRALAGRTWREAFFLTETNHTGDIDDGTAITHDAMRVFRNRPEYRFEGRIHEQIAQHLPAYLPERQERTTVRVEHFGYLGAVRDTKDKTSRNLALLERQAAEGDDTPFLHFNLGSEYAATGDAPRALTHLARAWRAVRDDRSRQQRRLRARAGRPLRARAAQHRPPGRGRHRRRRGAGDLPRLHRHRARAGTGRRRRRRPRARGGAAAPLPGDGRRAQPLLGDRGLRDLSRHSWRWPTCCAAAARWTRPRRRCAAACRSTPASWPPSTPTPPRCCAAASPRPTSSRRSTPSWPTPRPACASCSPSH